MFNQRNQWLWISDIIRREAVSSPWSYTGVHVSISNCEACPIVLYTGCTWYWFPFWICKRAINCCAEYWCPALNSKTTYSVWCEFFQHLLLFFASMGSFWSVLSSFMWWLSNYALISLHDADSGSKRWAAVAIRISFTSPFSECTNCVFCATDVLFVFAQAQVSPFCRMYKSYFWFFWHSSFNAMMLQWDVSPFSECTNLPSDASNLLFWWFFVQQRQVSPSSECTILFLCAWQCLTCWIEWLFELQDWVSDFSECTNLVFDALWA